MSSFESNAARNLPDAEAPKSGRRKKPPVPDAIPLADVDEVFDEKKGAWRSPADAALPELTRDDLIESYDPETNITELGPHEYEETIESKNERTAKKKEEWKTAIKKNNAKIRNEGEERRAAMVREFGQQEAEKQAAHEARLARIRNWSVGEPEPLVARESPKADPEGRFITKTQAYTAIAKRMKEISSDLADIHDQGRRGSELTERALNAEAKELIEALQGVQDATGEATGGLVANPFFRGTRAEDSNDTIPLVQHKPSLHETVEPPPVVLKKRKWTSTSSEDEDIDKFNRAA